MSKQVPENVRELDVLSLQGWIDDVVRCVNFLLDEARERRDNPLVVRDPETGAISLLRTYEDGVKAERERIRRAVDELPHLTNDEAARVYDIIDGDA